jgi:hypothetical protein
MMAPAQGVFSNHTNAALQKVIEDYPNRFRNIKGDRLSEYAEAVDYKSKVEVPGSVACVITQLSKREGYSWKCELFESKDFDKAKNKFSEIFNQIHNTIIKVDGEKPVILNGKFEMPGGDKKPTNIFFHLLPAGVMQKLKVELTLQSTPSSDWKVVLTVYEQDAQGDFAADAR